MKTDWDKIGSDYSEVEDSRRTTVFPFLWNRIETLRSQTVLDYGGGDGTFISMHGKRGKIASTVFEPCSKLRKIAKVNLSGHPVKIVAKPCNIDTADFDVIVMNAVWMSLTSRAACIRVLKRIYNLLDSQGTFFASVTHPCFRDSQFSTFHTNFKREWYLQSGKQFVVKLDDGKHRVSIVDTHWTLSDMSEQLASCGFAIRRIWEIPDSPIALSPFTGIPWLVIEAGR